MIGFAGWRLFLYSCDDIHTTKLADCAHPSGTWRLKVERVSLPLSRFVVAYEFLLCFRQSWSDQIGRINQL